MSNDVDQTIETETETVDTETNDLLATDMDVTSVADDGSTDAGVDDAASATDGTAVSTPDQDAWRQSYEALGFQNLESPEQAQQRMQEAYRRQQEQLNEASERIRYMQAVHSRLDNLSTGSQPSQPSTPAQDPSDLLTQLSTGWDEPDREMLGQYLTKDENGEPQWKADTPDELRKQVQQYQMKQAAWHKVLADPRQLDQAINQRVERMLSDRIEGVLTQRDAQVAEQTAEQRFFAENDWLFEKDPVTGGTYVNPVSGRPVLTRDGHQFSSVLESVKQRGVGRVSDQLEFATALFRQQQAQVRQAPLQQRAAVQPTVEQQRAAMLGRTNKTPAKPVTAAGITDGPGASKPGASRQSWGQTIVGQITEERIG